MREIIFAERIEEERIIREKRKLVQKLLDKVEQKIKKRQIQKRVHSVKHIRTNSENKKMMHQERVQYVETSIEKDIVYFGKKIKSFQDVINLEI